MTQIYQFVVSSTELKRIEEIVSSDELLRESWRQRVEAHGEGFALNMSRDQAQELQNSLTTELARVGFAADYSLNEEGKLLEALIDRFFIP